VKQFGGSGCSGRVPQPARQFAGIPPTASNQPGQQEWLPPQLTDHIVLVGAELVAGPLQEGRAARIGKCRSCRGDEPVHTGERVKRLRRASSTASWGLATVPSCAQQSSACTPCHCQPTLQQLAGAQAIGAVCVRQSDVRLWAGCGARQTAVYNGQQQHALAPLHI